MKSTEDITVGSVSVHWQWCGTKRHEVFVVLKVGEHFTEHCEGDKEATRMMMEQIDVLREDLRLMRKRLLHVSL